LTNTAIEETINPVLATGSSDNYKYLIISKTSYRGWKMKRGELAATSGCNAETIRYYEKIGLIPEPRRAANGYREYSDMHKERLHFVQRGRELGFTIDDLKSLLSLVDRNAVSCNEVEQMATQHLLSVQSKIDHLQRMEAALVKTISSCSKEDVPECPLIESLFNG